MLGVWGYLSQMTPHVVCDEGAFSVHTLWSLDGCFEHYVMFVPVVVLFKGCSVDESGVHWIPVY